MPYNNEQIMKALEALPLEFQEAIADSSLANKVMALGARYSLHIDQTGKLQDTALLALLGLIPDGAFSETLAKELSISENQARLITRDINEEIFGSIKKSIRERTEEPEVEEESKITPPAPLPATAIVHKEETIDREELLRGIENPSPMVKTVPLPTALSSWPPSASSRPLATPTIPARPAITPPKTPAVLERKGSPPENLPVAAPSPLPALIVPPEETIPIPPAPPILSEAPMGARSAIAPPSIVAQKLSAPTVSATPASAPIASALDALKKVDPYRETIS